jgi:hypothetical protein
MKKVINKMIWKEIKTWATKNGYKVDRTKVFAEELRYNYTWEYELASGTATSTFNLAKDIYNNITNNTYSQYQIDYEKIQTYNNIHSISTY